MNYWIFTVRDQFINDTYWTGPQVFERRMSDGFWGIEKSIRFIQQLDIGDRVVVYVAFQKYKKQAITYNGKYFAGVFLLNSSHHEVITQKEIRRLQLNDKRDSPLYGVYLKDIKVFREKVFLADVKPLSKFWEGNVGFKLRGSVNPIPRSDFEIIKNLGV